MGTLITALVLLVIVIWVLASCIKIVPQYQHLQEMTYEKSQIRIK